MGVHTLRWAAGVAAAVSRGLRPLSSCVPAALLIPAAVIAQTAAPASLSTDIPSRPLAEALATFAQQTGLQLVYVSDVVRNRRSRAVKAGFGTDAALTRLLQGTGLRYEYLTPGSIRIIAAPFESPGNAASLNVAGETEDVVVTANRREEEAQRVPIAIQVLTGEGLARLNARTLEDFVGSLPAVTARGVGPGQNSLYVRGLATATSGIQGFGFNGPFPNVAVYLDEQSVQLPGRNLDIYAVDLERIEVLEGPQGTLFGAGAQAGVVRYITNKPKLDVTGGAANVGAAVTSHGATSRSVDIALNIPLIPEHLAARAVFYDDHRGGYIDNRPATFARADSDIGIAYAGGKVPANSVVINNHDLAATDINPVSYKGIRVAALYQIDDAWSALIAQSSQSMDAHGVFAQMAVDSSGQPREALGVELFNPSYDKDRFENTALTIEGRVSALKVLYSGAYLARNIDQVQDYTNYARGAYADYYQCANPQPGNPATAQCFTPSETWRERERNTHLSHELRVSTSEERRVRALGGLFYEDYRIQDRTDWYYVTALPYFSPIAPPTGYYAVNGAQHLPDGTPVTFFTPGAVFVPFPVTSSDPSVRPLGDGFFNDITRRYRQRAAYASVDLELVPHALTLTVGTRYFRSFGEEVGSSVGSFGCKSETAVTSPSPCIDHSNIINLDSQGLRQRYAGFRSRVTLSWQIDDGSLLYFTWSEGYRASAFNRTGLCSCGSPLLPGSAPWQAQARQHGGWESPIAAAPDDLTNNEFGWKLHWMGGAMQWNGAVYQENWRHAQLPGSGILAASGLAGNQNGGDYRIRGLEASIVARVARALTFNLGVAWSHGELARPAVFRWRDGTPIDFSTLRDATGRPVGDPRGTAGSPLAAPPFQGSLRVRYEFALAGHDAFAQLAISRQSHSLATTPIDKTDLQGQPLNYDLSPFTTYAAAAGINAGAWLVQLYGENLTDTRAQLFANYNQFYKAVTVNRPRTLGLRLSYSFGGR